MKFDLDLNGMQQTTTAVPALLIMTFDEVRVALRCESKRAAHDELAYLGVKPYRRGKYRFKDIENAIARKALQAREAKA